MRDVELEEKEEEEERRKKIPRHPLSLFSKTLGDVQLGSPLWASVVNKGRSVGGCGKGCREFLSSFVPVPQGPGSKADAFVPGKLYVW